MAHEAMVSNVREWREAVGMSQEQLARHVGVTRAAISTWEVGESCPSLLHAILLADVLGCDVLDLFCMNAEEEIR